MYAANFCIILVIILLNKSPVTFQVPFFLDNDPIEQIQYLVNTSKDPCKDFYSYSCSKWTTQTIQRKYEPIWNKHLELNYKIIQRIQGILTEENNSSKALQKAQQFYKSCVNVSQHEQEYLTSLKLLLEFLNGWPIAQRNWRGGTRNWIGDVVQALKIVRVTPLVKISVNLDYRNTSVRAFYLEPGTLVFPVNILTNPAGFPKEINAYKAWIYNTVKHMYPGKKLPNLELDTLKIINFEMKLAKISLGLSKMEHSNLQKLSRRFPTVNWWRIFNYLVGKNSWGKPNTIIIKNQGYLKKLFVLLQKTDRRTIGNYILWHIVKDLSRDSTKILRQLNFIVDKTILGVQEDLPREIECINKANTYFSLAIIPRYIQLYLRGETLKEVAGMTEEIRDEFVEILRRNQWLTNGTRELAMEKVENLRSFIGFPHWVLKGEILHEYYETLNLTDNYFLNVLNAKNFLVTKEFSQLNNREENIEWPSNIFEVNAYYSVLQNAIFIPLGILEPPFFWLNRSRAINYGALGSLIGHEISHSLDYTGRQADKHGIIKKWWPEDDMQTYQKKAECYEHQYNNLNSNGLVTIGENIADNTGLEISFAAFRKFNQTEVMAKLFFASFAQMWCENSNKLDVFKDEHATGKARIQGTTFNNPDFWTSFNCEKTAETKCKLW